MKHRWTLLLFGAPLFVLFTSMQTLSPRPNSAALKVEVSTTSDMRVQLTAQNETGKKLYLSVQALEPNAFYGITETEIYTEEVSGGISKFDRILNLSKLEKGSYRIRISAGKERFERLLDIKAKPAEIVDTSRVILLQ